jgi:capsular exopolysaccharide synthesis family protein
MISFLAIRKKSVKAKEKGDNGKRAANDDGSELIILYDDERISKAFAAIRSNIQNLEGERTIKSIMFTGSIRGEGTSTIAFNFAASTAETGEARVLLIDANLRHPCQHKLLGIDNAIGLSNVLFDNARVEQAVKRTSINNLDLMPSGNLQINLNRLLNKESFKRTLNSLEDKYSNIIIDCPPVTVFSDAVTISGEVDGVIVVVAAHKTRREVIGGAIKQLENSGAHLLGSVLNKREYVIPEKIYRKL